MRRRIVVGSKAEADLATAFDWYQERRPGLGRELLAEVEECLQRIEANPFAYAEVHNRYRCALLARFPFKVFYAVEADYVSVVAILHAAQHPQRWRARMQPTHDE